MAVSIKSREHDGDSHISSFYIQLHGHVQSNRNAHVEFAKCLAQCNSRRVVSGFSPWEVSWPVGHFMATAGGGCRTAHPRLVEVPDDTWPRQRSAGFLEKVSKC